MRVQSMQGRLPIWNSEIHGLQGAGLDRYLTD